MKKYYNTNYSLLVTLLLPIRLRKNITAILLRSLVRPLELISESFIEYIEALVVSANSQVCYMEAMINDEFDFIERRIKIRTTDVDLEALITWKKTTNKRILIPSHNTDQRFLLNAKGQIGANGKDFEIVFPLGYTLSESEMTKLKQIVNRHKLSTKKYIVVNE